MKEQILIQKTGLFIFLALLFIYCIPGMVYADLVFTEGETTTREIGENTTRGTNIGSPLGYSAEGVNSCTRVTLRGPDARAFEVVRAYRGAQLKTKSALDFEAKNSYEVRVTASGAGSSDTIRVTVIVRTYAN